MFLSQARERGRVDGTSGAFDEWSFSGGRLPPYLEQLRVMPALIAAHSRLLDKDNTEADTAARHRAKGELGIARDRAAPALREHREVHLQLHGTAIAIDRLAALEAFRRERRLRYAAGAGTGSAATREPEFARPDPPGPDDFDPEVFEPGSEDLPGAGTDQEPAPDTSSGSPPGQPPSGDDPTQDSPPADPADQTGPIGTGGTGGDAGSGRTHDRHALDVRPSGRHFFPRLTWHWRVAVLAALVAVELPIQYVIFSYFHGDSSSEIASTVLFTIAVALIMVLAPHLAGHLYRRRHVPGTERRLLSAIALGMLVPCAYVAGMLGYLRAEVLLAGATLADTTEDDGGGAVPSKLDSFGLHPWTLIVMFVALMLLTGAISFLLGMAQEHPLIHAYREALQERRRLTAQLDEVTPAVHQADARSRTAVDAEALHADQWQQQLAALPALCHAAALAYLDALSQAMDEPAATEAIAGMAARLAAEPGFAKIPESVP